MKNTSFELDQIVNQIVKNKKILVIVILRSIENRKNVILF